MDMKGTNISNQFKNKTNNRVSDKECIIKNSDKDATMTLQHGWNDDDIGVSEKDIHEIKNIEEDISNYYVEDDEKYSNKELQSNAGGINILKRKAELGGDENFKGFDVEPYDVHEFKQFVKRIKNECISTNHEQPINVDKKEELNAIPEGPINSNLLLYLETKDTENDVATLEENITNKQMTNEIEKGTEQKKKDNKSNHAAESILHAEQQLNKSSPTRNAIYRKPLQMGWKRELVHRANPSSSRDKGEAYYITPSGKKLRTKGEILQHLTPESGLTIENFTFTREALGFGPNEEIIRCAKLKSNNNDFVLFNRKQSLDNSGNLGKRIPKPKVPKGASPPPHGWTPVKAVKAGSSLMSPRLIPQIKNAEDIENKSGLKSIQKISKQTKKGEPCTIQCVLAMGTIPQLQCTKCLCLFHNECVGEIYDKNDDDDEDGTGKSKKIDNDDPPRVSIGSGVSTLDGSYVCEFCRNNALKTPPPSSSLQSSIIDSSSLQPITSALLGTSSRTQPPQIQSTNVQLIDEHFKKASIATTTITSTQMTAKAKPPIKTALSSSLITPDPSHDSSFSTANNIEISDNLPQSIAVIKGRKYVVIRKSAGTSLSSSPRQNSTDPGTFIAKENIQTDSTKNVNSRNKMSSIDSVSTTNQQQSTALYRSLSENFSTNFFGNVSLGYDILLHTFQYLKVQELLRAACVCRMWNVVANHRSLWKTVRMKNSQIKNWFGLSGILRRNETKHLDLRKMLISSTNGDEMWQSFLLNIKTVKSLEIIDLCKCSANIVEELFISELNLEILNAVAIKDDTLNLVNLHNLKNLQELRLKSIDGCNLESNLQSLKALKNLKHLSLTSFRELGTKEICYIGELTCLETLELGECTEFNKEFVEGVLLKLQKLERLRLEKGQEPCCTLNILEGISKISTLTQLELVNFDVRTGFDDKLSQCKNLKKLLLIPTYVSQSATTNNIVLKALLNLSDTLRSLTWVVTLELLRVTALYVVQCDDKKKDNKVFDESIPVLKPVPSSLNDDNSNEKITAGAGTGQQKITSTSSSEVPQVEILPLTKVERILLLGMPDTKFKILKVPYHATWRQNLIEIQ